MKASVTAGLSGALFGVGLVISGMTDPRNVIGFLDVFGHFNPNLAGVMAGAIAVHALGLHLLSRRATGASPSLSLRPRSRVDAPLVAGAAIFGVGWGLGGYCPGPAIVALGFGYVTPFAFVAASVVGMFLADACRSMVSRDGGRTHASRGDTATLDLS